MGIDLRCLLVCVHFLHVLVVYLWVGCDNEHSKVVQGWDIAVRKLLKEIHFL
jgi:hypothetical protein